MDYINANLSCFKNYYLIINDSSSLRYEKWKSNTKVNSKIKDNGYNFL